MQNLVATICFICTTASAAPTDLILGEWAPLSLPQDSGSIRSPLGSSFSATITAISDFGSITVDNGTGSPSFGGVSLIGQSVFSNLIDINIETSVTAGPDPSQSTLTFRFFTEIGGTGVTRPFVPVSSTIGGDFVGRLVFDIGDFDAGLDLVEFNPNPGFSIDSASFSVFADSALIGSVQLQTDPVGPPGLSGIFANGGAGISIRSAVNAGTSPPWGNITTLGIDEAVFSATITTVPEPASAAILCVWGIALLRRRRAV